MMAWIYGSAMKKHRVIKIYISLVVGNVLFFAILLLASGFSFDFVACKVRIEFSRVWSFGSKVKIFEFYNEENTNIGPIKIIKRCGT